MDVDFVKFSVVSFCGNRIFMVNIEVCCHFAAVVLSCLDTMLLSVWWFLSFTFSFQALFFFADCWLVLPFFLYEVIIVNTVVFKTQNNWAVKQLNSHLTSVICLWQVTHFTHAMYSTPHSPQTSSKSHNISWPGRPAFSMFKRNYVTRLGICLTEQQRFGFEALTLTRISDKKGILAGEERKERWEEMEKPSVKCFMAELLHCSLTNDSLAFELYHWSLFFHSMTSSSSSSPPFFSHTQSAIIAPPFHPLLSVFLLKENKAIQVTICDKHNS